MKWYKKQLDKLKIFKKEPANSEEDNLKTKVGSFGRVKTGFRKNNFVNPVAARNKNRPKTDLY